MAKSVDLLGQALSNVIITYTCNTDTWVNEHMWASGYGLMFTVLPLLVVLGVQTKPPRTPPLHLLSFALQYIQYYWIIIIQSRLQNVSSLA